MTTWPTPMDVHGICHAIGCPANTAVIRPYPTRHGDVVSWCPGCCRTGIAPSPTTTASTRTPRRFEYPHPDDLDYLEETA